METTKKGKWFYIAQKAADAKLKEMYSNRGLCDYQIVSKDRVIEGWTVFDENGKLKGQVQVMILKKEKGFSILIHELNLVASC